MPSKRDELAFAFGADMLAVDDRRIGQDGGREFGVSNKHVRVPRSLAGVIVFRVVDVYLVVHMIPASSDRCTTVRGCLMMEMSNAILARPRKAIRLCVYVTSDFSLWLS